MSIDAPNPQDLHEAGLRGMGNVRGDAEVLEDLGIPMGPYTYGKHLESSAAVWLATESKHRDALTDGDYPFEPNLGNFAGGTPDQRAVHRQGAAAARASIEAVRNQQ